MWKPPQRIKYIPLADTWPSREESAHARLFAPVALGPLQLEQRTWVPAMVPWRASDDGEVTEDVLDWYGRFARGRPGAIVVEATGIRDVPSGPLLRIGHDRFLPGLQRLVERVRIESGGHTRLLIQVIDFLGIRRRPEREKYLRQFLQITDRHRRLCGAPAVDDDALREQLCQLDDDRLAEILDAREWEALTMGHRERVTDTALPHIAELPRVLPGLFADAAGRARDAGFDGVELHYAHAYTMASFLSATNTRTDGYGGSLEQRLRLPLEVYARVRQAVGADFALGCRFLADECIEGGNAVAEATQIGVALAAAGMDFLSLSRGGKFDDAKQPKVGEASYPYTGVSGYECMPGYISDEFGPYGRNIEPTAAIRAAVRAAGYDTPVVVAGGIHTFTQAETLLQQDRADIIAFARQALADPDWFEKVRTGCGAQVRLCEYTNYCEGLDQKHKQVTCNLWDRLELDEPGIRKSRDGRRRLTAPAWKRD
ncbi:MAG: NADH:flavin oxidoreductase [Gammaproteobacteria bacterium]|nr:NADH:flavin oxidoreductase [Gammaproteobacteria bacterium]MDH5171160.1 NADH:flavin oxidoreductase [Gammaproteobacteria bacterium]